MSTDLTTLIVLIFLVPHVVWSVFLTAKSLGILARARGETRTLAGLAMGYTLEVFVTTSVLIGYLLASVSWISWPSSDSQNLWVLFPVLVMVFALLTPLFFRHWSTPELKRLHGEIRRLALARGALIPGLLLLGLLLIFTAYALLAQAFLLSTAYALLTQAFVWSAVLNIAVLVFVLLAWMFTARGLMRMADVLSDLKNLNPVQAGV